MPGRRGRCGKNSGRAGEANHRSKVDEIDVRNIRAAYLMGQKLRDLARIFGISFGQVHRIVTYQNWRHIE